MRTLYPTHRDDADMIDLWILDVSSAVLTNPGGQPAIVPVAGPGEASFELQLT